MCELLSVDSVVLIVRYRQKAVPIFRRMWVTISIACSFLSIHTHTLARSETQTQTDWLTSRHTNGQAGCFNNGDRRADKQASCCLRSQCPFSSRMKMEMARCAMQCSLFIFRCCSAAAYATLPLSCHRKRASERTNARRQSNERWRLPL